MGKVGSNALQVIAGTSVLRRSRRVAEVSQAFVTDAIGQLIRGLASCPVIPHFTYCQGLLRIDV